MLLDIPNTLTILNHVYSGRSLIVTGRVQKKRDFTVALLGVCLFNKAIYFLIYDLTLIKIYFVGTALEKSKIKLSPYRAIFHDVTV